MTRYQCWAYAGLVQKWTMTRYQCWAYAGLVQKWTMNDDSLPALSLCRSREKWTMNDDSLPVLSLCTVLSTGSKSSFIIHRSFLNATCIGSALVARENRNDSFILTGSLDTDLRIIFHVTCDQKRKQKGFVYLVYFRVARFSKRWMIFLHK